MIVMLMGVSGSGKTTVGELLAAKLGWQFVDADDFHPAENVEKMRQGLPLTHDDRRPWLSSLREYLGAVIQRGESLVLACSALSNDYREYLTADRANFMRIVYLQGSEELIAKRLADRQGHFMPLTLLRSQFDALEPPHNALRVDISPSPEAIVETIVHQLTLPDVASPGSSQEQDS